MKTTDHTCWRTVQ